MGLYSELIDKSMQYLNDNKYTKAAISAHRVCYREFGKYLDNCGLPYSIDVGNRWLNENKSEWAPWLYRSRRKCLQRIEELYIYGKVFNVQYYGHISDYDTLNELFRNQLDKFLELSSESYSDLTLKECRCACSAFLMFMQKRGRRSFEEIRYLDLIAFHELDTHKSKMHNECYIRKLLSFAASKAWCSQGFSILLSQSIIHRALFLDDFITVKPQSLEALRTKSLEFPSHEFLVSVDQFVAVSESKRYCSAYPRIERRCLLSLYLFLDINGFGYDPEISDLWLTEMRLQLNSQFVEWRRILEQYKVFYKTRDFSPEVVLSYKADPAEALPDWIKKELNRFLSLKKKEGLSQSSLDNYKCAVIRFSEFLTRSGISEFRAITPEVLMQFNREDYHKTPKGKSTYNSRLAGFIEYLSDSGIIENNHLHRILPRHNAKSVKIIETLTEEEMEKIDCYSPAEIIPLELRDHAMVLVARRLGFRKSDIVDIEYNDIDWKKGTISTLQRKTKKGLILPLPNDVRNAIVRYMKYGRPYSRCPKIFIKHMVPYNELTSCACDSALSRILYGEKGHPVKFQRIRKSFGTGLIRGGAAHDIASKMLGHSTSESLASYFSADEERMRMLPLSLSDLGILPKGGLIHETTTEAV